ncbi:hypothetical protein B566_EDAN002566 [Ephemera danica]|nr:hypothetical protein B566_EDAN002566 [Ephemera danica]
MLPILEQLVPFEPRDPCTQFLSACFLCCVYLPAFRCTKCSSHRLLYPEYCGSVCLWMDTTHHGTTPSQARTQPKKLPNPFVLLCPLDQCGAHSWISHQEQTRRCDSKPIFETLTEWQSSNVQASCSDISADEEFDLFGLECFQVSLTLLRFSVTVKTHTGELGTT